MRGKGLSSSEWAKLVGLAESREVTHFGAGMTRAVRPALSSPGEYLSAAQLAAITPWSPAAIEKMMKRGILQRDVHYFQPFGPRTQLLFKWSTIVMRIEGRSVDGDDSEKASVLEQGTLDVEKATAKLGRLLGR